MTDFVLLLVEDNRDDEALIVRALKKSELSPRLLVSHDGAEALADLDRRAAEPDSLLPDVVLLDLNLPKVGGFEVLRRIRAHPRTRRIPVVILTSSREERDIATSYELGATSYVRKPIGSEQFLEVIKQVGQYWLRINERPPRSGWPEA